MALSGLEADSLTCSKSKVTQGCLRVEEVSTWRAEVKHRYDNSPQASFENISHGISVCITYATK